MSASTTATTGSYRLELGGQSLSVNAIEGGGAVGVVVSGPPTGGAPFREKHLAGVRYEPIAIAASFGSARPLFDLVRSAWQGMPPQNNGAVIRVGANGRPVSRREFVKAVLAETIIPNLDGASNSPAYVTVRLAPELTRDVTPPATLPPRAPRRPRPCHRISGSISPASTAPKSPRSISFTVKQRLAGETLDNGHYQEQSASGRPGEPARISEPSD